MPTTNEFFEWSEIETPQAPSNDPGLPAIAYRVGTYPTFKETMLSRLSSTDYPALKGLNTRSDQDFTVAYLDAAATVMDVLTFYQERIANENYLRTAQENISLSQLAQLTGYQPSPGLAANVSLAFTLSSSSNLPSQSSAPVTIPTGTQVQTVPGPGQTTQTFETIAPIQAQVDWNAIDVQNGQDWTPVSGDTQLYLAGTATQLNVGDSVLILAPVNSTQVSWSVRVLQSVQPDTVNSRTLITWTLGLDSSALYTLSLLEPAVYAFRQKAALFGNNAPDPNLFVVPGGGSPSVTNLPNLINDGTVPWVWKNYMIQNNQVDLDATYSKILPGGFFVMSGPVGSTATTELYVIDTAVTVSRSDYGLSQKITRLTTDPLITIPNFVLNETQVLVQAEFLPTVNNPVFAPIYGSTVPFEEVVEGLVPGQTLAVSGKRLKVQVAEVVNSTFNGMNFVLDDGSGTIALSVGDVLTFVDSSNLPVNSDGTPNLNDWSTATLVPALHLEDAGGRTGLAVGVAVTSVTGLFLNQFTPVATVSTDPTVQEVVIIDSASGSVVSTHDRTTVLLELPFQNCYDRTTTSLNANVAPATQGATVTEILGSGDASLTNQTFTLKQPPLTYISSSASPTGSVSTLQIVVNGLTWTEVPSLYGQKSTAQVYTVITDEFDNTNVVFGDGIEGSLLPTGQNNVQATYRKGLGIAGNVGAGILTLLIDRPLGVNAVTNPAPATGGQDPATIEAIRTSAPLETLTLGRAVSITDYTSYAQAFAGIAKALAVWIISGAGRGVYLTVAGANGASIGPGDPIHDNLIVSLQNSGNPLIPIRVVSYDPITFFLTAALKIDPRANSLVVTAAVESTLREAFSFENRTFGQDVSLDEVCAVIQGVSGVIAVNVTQLYLGAQSGQPPVPALNYVLTPTVPLSTDQVPLPAQILTLDPGPINLGVLS